MVHIAVPRYEPSLGVTTTDLLEIIFDHGYTSLNKITQGRMNEYQKEHYWITIFNAIR